MSRFKNRGEMCSAWGRALAPSTQPRVTYYVVTEQSPTGDWQYWLCAHEEHTPLIPHSVLSAYVA